MPTPDELTSWNYKNGYYHRLSNAEGKDLIEAAAAALDKAAFWKRPESYDPFMFDTAMKFALVRSNIALAVEIRALRKTLEKGEAKP